MLSERQFQCLLSTLIRQYSLCARCCKFDDGWPSSLDKQWASRDVASSQFFLLCLLFPLFQAVYLEAMLECVMSSLCGRTRKFSLSCFSHTPPCHHCPFVLFNYTLRLENGMNT